MNTVQLVAVTQSSIPGIDTLEDFIAYCARVSNPSNQMTLSTVPRLLRYLISHQHWSPFEMAAMTMEITTTRDIARQILRHRSFSFQEFSQRYSQALQAPSREARLQDYQNRQNSLQNDDEAVSEWWREAQENVLNQTLATYQEALNRGIAKEVARSVLPEGLTSSTLYMTGTVRSWIHYAQLRYGVETQKEHREIAGMCRDILLEQMPSLEKCL